MKKLLSIITILTLLLSHAVHAKVDKDVNVAKVQAMLAELCYKPGIVDGAWGKKTETAVKAFFAKHYRKYDGNFDVSDANFILSAGASAKAFGSASVKKCLVVYSDRIGDDLKNTKIKQITQKVANKKKKSNKIHFFDNKYEIPDDINWQPNDATLSHYYTQTANIRHRRDQTFGVNPTREPFIFKKALESHKVIDREMSEGTIFSYLYYEDGMVVYDALPPKNRFKAKLNNSSYFPSHSMGKSITSYLTGHAICQGYIKSVDAPIEGWPLMENTLYYGQPLINLLNMQAGDTHIIKQLDGRFIKSGRAIHGNGPLSMAVRNPKELKDTKPQKNAQYAYSNLTTDIIFNYIMYRVGNKFSSFISNFYKEKIKIEHPVYLWMNPINTNRDNPSIYNRIKEGAGQYGITATRYDFLRIAKAIMDDWQNDTCEGQYLKEIYERRVSKNKTQDRWDSTDRRVGKTNFGRQTKSYAGQFHSDVVGLLGRNILVLNGANGQQIVIDMDNSRIVVIGAVKAHDYDSYKLGYEPIKYGRIR